MNMSHSPADVMTQLLVKSFSAGSVAQQVEDRSPESGHLNCT